MWREEKTSFTEEDGFIAIRRVNNKVIVLKPGVVNDDFAWQSVSLLWGVEREGGGTTIPDWDAS